MYTENNLSIYKYIDINILFLLYIIIETFGERADFSYDYTIINVFIYMPK